MAGWGGVWHGPVDIGAAVYAGIGISATQPNAGQASLLFSLADVLAIGPGVQLSKDPIGGDLIWQGLFSVALNYTVGASTHYLQASARNAQLQGQAEGMSAARAK